MEQTRTEATESLSDDDLQRRIKEDSQRPVSPDRANRFYDRVRRSIQEFVDRRAGMLGKTTEYLLLVPDIFMLLWRLTTDSRVTGKNKVLLGSAIAYFILPFDLVPEALLGPIGYMDDLVFAVYVLNTMLVNTDPSVLREHWSGSEDVLMTIQKVLNAADSLVATNVLGRIKKMVKK